MPCNYTQLTLELPLYTISWILGVPVAFKTNVELKSGGGLCKKEWSLTAQKLLHCHLLSAGPVTMAIHRETVVYESGIESPAQSKMLWPMQQTMNQLQLGLYPAIQPFDS